MKSLDKEVVEAYDRENIGDFSKFEIQQLVDNLICRKVCEKWVINLRLMDVIIERTGGHPRDVVKLCRDLLDERRGNGSEGTLETLMSWSGRIDDTLKVPFEPEIEPDEPIQGPETTELDQDWQDEEPVPEDSDDWDVEPEDMWEDDSGSEDDSDWDETIPEVEDDWNKFEFFELSNSFEDG